MSYFKGVTLKTHSIILYLMHTLKIDFFSHKGIKGYKNKKPVYLYKYAIQASD